MQIAPVDRELASSLTFITQQIVDAVQVTARHQVGTPVASVRGSAIHSIRALPIFGATLAFAMASSIDAAFMNRKRCASLAISVLTACLLFAVTSCSRGYKTGSSITPADLAKALPEFPITLPPGGTNLYLEHDSRPPLLASWLKVAVPVSSLTNFLRSFGFPDEFMTATPQMIRSQRALPLAMDTRSPASWIGSLPIKAHHAAEWDLGKGTTSLRLYSVARPGMSSTNDRVILFGYVDGAATNNATVYLEYHCLHVSKISVLR